MDLVESVILAGSVFGLPGCTDVVMYVAEAVDVEEWLWPHREHCVHLWKGLQ